MNTTQAETKRVVQIGKDSRNIIGGASKLLVICGPCVIESADHLLFLAEKITTIARRLDLPIVFKASYDKANRTSSKSFRGIGIEGGLELLAKVRSEFSVPIVTDVHTVEEIVQAGEVVDLIQIPAFLCRQTDLLIASGRTKKPVMIKKGQFVAPEDMVYAARKVVEGGGDQVLLCERGACFGYRDLVVDLRSLQIMSEAGFPVVFDATHSVQSLGGSGGVSQGARKFIPALARGAVAAGIDGIFLECHDDPQNAKSDAESMLPLANLEGLLSDLKRLHELQMQTGYRSSKRA